MNGFSCIIIIGLFTIICSFIAFENTKPIKTKMDIATIIEDNKRVNRFISKYFETVDTSFQNPIFPCKVNLKTKPKVTITFCDFPVADCWVLKKEESFTFFLIIKDDSSLVDSISKRFGEKQIESEIEANGFTIKGKTHYWEIGQLNILLNSFRNVNKISQYEKCVMLTIGNMGYSETLNFPKRGF